MVFQIWPSFLFVYPCIQIATTQQSICKEPVSFVIARKAETIVKHSQQNHFNELTENIQTLLLVRVFKTGRETT